MQFLFQNMQEFRAMSGSTFQLLSASNSITTYLDSDTAVMRVVTLKTMTTTITVEPSLSQ